MPRMIVTVTEGEVLLPASKPQLEETHEQRMERILCSGPGRDGGWNIGDMPVSTQEPAVRPLTAWELEIAAVDAADPGVPACTTCGQIMHRLGNGYKCRGCGSYKPDEK